MSDKLRVKPIDTSAPGSWRERNRILRQLAAVRDAANFIDGQIILDDLLASRFETVDGSDLDAALAELSADDANELVKMLLVAEEESVPTTSAGN